MSGATSNRTLLAQALVAAADAAGIGLIVTRLSGPEPVNLYVNDAAARIVGRAPRDMLGPTFTFTPPDELPRMRDLGARAARGEPVPMQMETHVVRPDGTRVPIEASISHVTLSGQPAAVAFIMDITQRKQAEEALLRSEKSFRELVENAPLAVWISDRSGIAYCNVALLTLFGYQDAREMLGMDPRRFTHPDDIVMLERRARAMLRRRERLPPFEYRVRRSDGSWMILEATSIAMDFQGRQMLVSFGREVTEQKQGEAQLLQADRLAALGMLAGGMAHSINNPLTYVLLNLDHIAKLLPGLQADSAGVLELLARLDEAHQGAERVADVVKRMRAFSRAEEHARGPVDVRRVLDAVIAMVGNEIRHRGELLVSYGDVPHVTANPARLEQAFLSLLLHAAQALPEDGQGDVRIAVKAEGGSRVLVDVSYRTPSEPAARDAQATDDTALGLGICKNIIGSLGGTLQIMPEVGGSASLRVTFPAAGPMLAPARTSAPPAASLPPPSRPLRARVLVVDDDPGVGRALRLMLEEEHEVTFVTSGREALRLLLREHFDVVFCDVMMPELTGMDLYQALRLNRPGDEQRLVFMTGGVFTPHAERFLTQVKNARIEKPFDMRSLRRLVERAVAAD